MALNPDKLQFLLNQAENAELNTITSIIGQIFSYMDQEVKDNPIFDKYESERKYWKDWPESDGYSFNKWTLPPTIDEAKSLAYEIYRRADDEFGEEDYIQNFAIELFRERYIPDNVRKLNKTFLGYFAEALKEIINANPERDTEQPKLVKNDTVFIIHGHDETLKLEVLLLLNRAGVNSFVLHEQPDGGRTIIDKLIQETNKAGYAVALLTPDDITHEGSNRARQNVILEIGYFLGKLGKERLRMIVKGNIDIPSDLQGILYEKFDSSGAWKIKLLKEIQQVGIYVDIQSTLKSF